MFVYCIDGREFLTVKMLLSWHEESSVNLPSKTNARNNSFSNKKILKTKSNFLASYQKDREKEVKCVNLTAHVKEMRHQGLSVVF